MQALRITEHSKAGWSTYAQEIGFVPDPMILRTGEVFLNGAQGVGRLKRRDFDVSVSVEAGIPFAKIGGKASFKPGIPTWLRLWWNDAIPFGGIHKTLRRMWMAAESYDRPADQLERVWSRS